MLPAIRKLGVGGGARSNRLLIENARERPEFANGIAAPDAGVFCICEWYARHSQARAVAAKASAN